MSALARSSRAVAPALLSVCVTLMVGALISCTNVTAPVESQENITLSREIEFSVVDSNRMNALDTIDAGQMSAAFNAVKERITRVGCTSPTLTVVGYNGTAATVIDTFFLYVGSPSENKMDTLTGPTLLTSTQLEGGAPQVLWVNSPTLWQTQNLLGHAPYGFAIRAYVHANHPISRVRIRIEFPLAVSYLN